MRNYFAWILSHRAVVIAIVALISLASLISLSRVTVASTVGDLFFGDAPPYLEYLDLIEDFGSDEVVAVAYEEPDLLGVEALDRLERITEMIARNPEIARITSVLDLQRIQEVDGVLQIDHYADLARADQGQRTALVAEIQADPLLAGRVFSRSGTHGLVFIELTVDPDRSGEVGPVLSRNCRAAFAAEGYDRSRIHDAGFPVVITEMLELTFFSLKVIFPITVLVLVGVVTVLFRTPLPVLLSVSVSLLSALWTVGASTLFNPTLNVFHAVVPSVVTIVAVSDVVHMWSAYLHELALGREREEALLCSATDVGRACLLTSVTTAVGFLSIALIPTPVFQELGIVLGFGVGIALLLAMTLVPIAASMGATPSVASRQMDNPIGHLVDRLVSACAQLSTRHPGPVIGGFSLVSLVLLWGFFNTTIEANFLHRLEAENPVRVDAAWFESEFYGTQSLDVFVTSDTPERMLDPEVMGGVALLEERLEAMEEVDDALSIIDLIKRIDTSLGGPGEVPNTRAQISQYLLLYEMGGGANLDPVLDFERRRTRLSLKLNEHRMRKTHELGEAASAIGAEVLPADVQTRGTGMMAIAGGWLDEIVRGQQSGVLVSVFSITVLMMIGVRSFSVGLWSMVPNLLPLVAVTAACHWVWGDLDSDTLVILMMAIGIGVDDTIHFLTRLRIESARSESAEIAIKRTFDFAGRAIVMTTVILALGFLPFLTSDYYSTWIMGSLLPLALIVAMFADLLLVPALVQVGWMRFPLAKQSAEG